MPRATHARLRRLACERRLNLSKLALRYIREGLDRESLYLVPDDPARAVPATASMGFCYEMDDEG
jgi:hypothetical protein